MQALGLEQGVEVGTKCGVDSGVVRGMHWQREEHSRLI